LEALRPQLEARGPSSGLAEFYLNLAVATANYGGPLEPALELVVRGSEAARAVGDPAWLFLCEMARGNVLYALGRPGEAEIVLRPLVHAKDGDGVPLDFRAGAPVHLGAALACQGKLAAGIDQAENSLELWERVDAPLGTQYTLSLLVTMEFLVGDWVAARRHAERVIAIADRVPREGWRMAMGITCLGKIALYQGSVVEGERHLLDVLARRDDPELASDAAAGLADHDLFAGRAEAALSRVASFPRSGSLRDLHHLDVLARAHLALGNASEAEAILTAWILQCRDGDRARYIDALWSLGTVQAAGERWAEADASFSEAVALAREMPYPFAGARALYHWGLGFGHRHRGDEARERLNEALAIFRRLGATPYVGRAEQALTDIGA
jgi:tetratricopeptide (TPR) repeat protein